MQSFSAIKVNRHLTTEWLGRKIVHKMSTPTTMDDARNIGKDGALQGTAVVAEVQTKGRGTKNHKWVSSDTGNIYTSVVLHRKKSASEFADRFNLEVSATLAVRKAVEELGVKDVHTKWPNDLWVKGLKLAGFLAEYSDYIIPDTDPQLTLVVLGIGVNVNSDPTQNEELQTLATSVRCQLGGATVSREQLFATMCNYLEQNLELSEADLHREFLQHHLFTRGDRVVVYPGSGQSYHATFGEVKDNWDVELQNDDGETVRGNSQQLSIRPAPTKASGC